MLIITTRLAGRLKSVFRQALALPTRGPMPPVQLVGGAHGLRIRCRMREAACEFLLDGEQPTEMIVAPGELLADVEGRREQPVELRVQNGRVLASWRDGSVPQTVRHDVPPLATEDWPAMPERLATNPPSLLPALADASATTDPDSSRYALGCMQLRGDCGRLVATDGRQILVQADFAFPWDGDVLVPASRVYSNKRLGVEEGPVLVGRTEEWFTLQAGPWTFWRKLDTKGRFPDAERHVTGRESALASVELSEADRRFLLENLGRLPGDETYNHPVTLDANGSVAVRAKGQHDATLTELILAGSTASGEPVRLNSNRQYLARAVQLGFHRLHVFGPQAPVLASDGHRQFLWAVLDADSALKPSEDAVRIDSADTTPEPPPVRRPRPRTKRSNKNTMPKKSDQPTQPHGNGHGNGHATASTPQASGGDVDAIEQATALRDVLREAASQTSQLLRQLKAERRQNKQIKGALASLKQLEPVGQ